MHSSYDPNNPYNSPGLRPSGPAQDEKLMAAASHASILLPHAGLLVALVLWLVHSGSGPTSGPNGSTRLPFVAFQSKQAFFFHLGTAALEWLVIVVGFALGFFTFGLGWGLIPLAGLVHLGAAIYGVVGAVHAFQGRDFRYPILGSLLGP